LSGYRLFFAQIAGIENFEWPGPPPPINPIAVSAAYVGSGDWIYRMAFIVIALFAAAYLKLLIWS
jgi:hypothetical protein